MVPARASSASAPLTIWCGRSSTTTKPNFCRALAISRRRCSSLSRASSLSMVRSASCPAVSATSAPATVARNRRRGDVAGFAASGTRGRTEYGPSGAGWSRARFSPGDDDATSSPGTRVPGKPSASSVDTSCSRVRVTVVAEEARAATDRARPARVPAKTRPSSRRVGTMTSRARPEVDAFLHADVPARVDPRPIPDTGPAPSVAIADIASPPRVSPRSHRSPPRAPCARTRKVSQQPRSAWKSSGNAESRPVRNATVGPSGRGVLLWITAPLFGPKI